MDHFATLAANMSPVVGMAIVLGLAVLLLLLVQVFLKSRETTEKVESYSHNPLRKAQVIEEIGVVERSIESLRRGIDQKGEELKDFKAEKTEERNFLVENHFRHAEPNIVLSNSTVEERWSLKKVLDVTTDDPEKLAVKIRSAGSNTFAILWRGATDQDPYVSYTVILDDVVRKVKATHHPAGNYYAKETEIVEKITSMMLEKMDASQKAKFFQDMEAEAEKHGKSFGGLAASGGGLALAHASGFGIYLAASSAVGALTGAMGLTLPFAFYTTMSSSIALFTGPVGWALLGGLGLGKLGAANLKKTIPAVAVIASIRMRLESERLEKIETIDTMVAEKEEELRKMSHQLNENERQLSKLQSELSKIIEIEPAEEGFENSTSCTVPASSQSIETA